MRPPAAVALCLAAIAIGGCSTSSNGVEGNTDPNDKRAAALTCLKEDQKVPAHLQGRDSIQVGDDANGPLIRFFITAGDAEARQFLGHGEGAEQIKSAWLYTRRGSDPMLQAAEECLNGL
jgi:hypothetical protein